MCEFFYYTLLHLVIFYAMILVITEIKKIWDVHNPKQKVDESESKRYFHEKKGIAYKGIQSGQLFLVYNDKVYRRAQAADRD